VRGAFPKGGLDDVFCACSVSRKRLAVKDKLLKSIENDEMRSLVLAGIVPRAEIRPPRRPETEGGSQYAQQLPVRRTPLGDERLRPSTVPTGFSRPTPATPQQISEALAYRPVPSESEVTEWDESTDHQEEGAAESVERIATRAQRSISLGLRSLGSGALLMPPPPPRPPLTTLLSGRPSPRPPQRQQFSRGNSSQGPRPPPQGRDLLAPHLDGLTRDVAMRDSALRRQRDGNALDEAQSAIDREEEDRGRLARRMSSSGRGFSLLDSPRSARLSPRPPPPGPLEGSAAADEQQRAPEAVDAPWVSPWTKRVATPISKARGLEVDARVSARSMGKHEPGVPVWKKSNAWLPAGSSITRTVKTIATDGDRAAGATSQAAPRRASSKHACVTTRAHGSYASRALKSALPSVDPLATLLPAAA
jgi:hypothetical protein